VIAAAIAASISNSSAAFGQTRSETIGAWLLTSHDRDGAFHYCRMISRVGDRARTLAFHINRNGVLYAAIYDQHWALTEKARYTAYYQLDSGTRTAVTMTAISGRVLNMPMTSDRLVYAQLRTASRLRVAVDGQPDLAGDYSIAGSAAAFDWLLRCLETGVYAAAPRGRGNADEQQGQDDSNARPRYTPPANPARPPPAARTPATPPANPPGTPPAGTAEKPARTGKPDEGALDSTGTGFFVSQVGHILTAEHVIRNCKSVRAQAIGDVPLAAVVVARSASDDLALLKTDAKRETVAAIRSGSLRLGEQIVVFGFPLTGALASSGNLTTGNIAALAGVRDDHRMMQISAPVQPGNSGGPVFDLRGRVVGVVLSGLGARFVRATGTLPQNINFGVKASVVSSFLEAHGVAADNNGAGADMAVADVADRARVVTVRVECLH
jgi:S1-C subfamily serine protease